MHYESGLTIAAIAGALGLEQRRLYTRRDAALRRLRAALESRGVDSARLFDALEKADDEGGLGFEEARPEPEDSGPSNDNEPRGSRAE